MTISDSKVVYVLLYTKLKVGRQESSQLKKKFPSEYKLGRMCNVWLPCYKGFSEFAVWPAPQSVSKILLYQYLLIPLEFAINNAQINDTIFSQDPSMAFLMWRASCTLSLLGAVWRCPSTLAPWHLSSTLYTTGIYLT